MITLKTVLRDYTKFHTDNYIKVFIEPFSIPLAWFFLNFTNLNANQVTICGFLAGMIGATAGALFHPIFSVIGYFVFLIFDMTDGKIARAKGTCHPNGKRLGRLSNRAVFAMTAFTLMYHHAVANESANILALMAYVLLYFYIDILDYTSLVVQYATGNPPAKGTREYILNAVLVDWTYWLPNRLSSPLFILFGYLLSHNPAAGYFCGSFAIIFRMLVMRMYTRTGIFFRRFATA